MEHIRQALPNSGARMTGTVYLLYFLTAIAGEFLLKGIVVANDPSATANNILAHETLFRTGIATGLIGTAWYVVMTALLYELFKPVSRRLSLVASFSGLTGCAIQAFSSIFQLAPLLILKGSPYLSGFNTEQMQDLALLSLKLRIQASNVGLMFFAIYCALLGWLILRATFLPRFFGLLLLLAGLGWMTILWPPLAHALSPYVQVLGVVAEGALMIWLLAKGVVEQRWRDQAQADRGQG